MNYRTILPGFAIALILAAPLFAEEGGAGRYVPGNTATLIDLLPDKAGWVFQTNYLHYEGRASAAATFPEAGLVTAGLDAAYDASISGAIYTFETPVLGSHYSVGAFFTYLSVEVEANVVIGGTTGNRVDSEEGFGDVTLLPVAMSWKHDSWQFGGLLQISAPTGDYDNGSLASLGRNHWTFDPTLQISYNNEETGFNGAVFAGVTLNTENDEADYRSGSAFHADLGVQQLLPLGNGYLSVGFNAFYYEQFQGDSGSGAILGDLKGSVLGIGPALGYVLPCGENTLVAEARWLPELDSRNRLEGDYFWLKLVYQF